MLFSLALSLLLSYNTLVNPDGILYLRSAQFVSEGQWLAGLKTYFWMFYAVLIAGFSSLSTLSLEHSAFVLNAILLATLTLGFITLVKLLGGDTRVQWLAAAVILAHPGLNGYRDYIIRDYGLWAFMLWALYFLIKYAEQTQFRYIIGWTASIILAFLFRIEAFLLLLAAPFGLYACMPGQTFKQKTIHILKAQSLLLLILISFFIVLFIYNKLHYLGRLYDLPKYLTFILFDSFDLYKDKATNFSEIMSVFFKPQHGMVALLGALVTYTVYLIVKLLSPLYTLLAGYGMYRKTVPNHVSMRMVIWFSIILFAALLGHLLQHFFFSSRYLVPLILLFMLWVPFGIEALIILGKKRLLIAIALIMTYMFVDGVSSFGYSKMYIKEAGFWLQQNKPEEKIYTNSTQVAYYAKIDSLNWDKDFNKNHTLELLQSNDWKDYDLLALRHSKNTAELNALIASLPNTVIIQDFYNKRNDGVVIIQVLD